MSETAPVPARDRIIAAFLEQLKTVPCQKIKVSALIKDAGVNRSTFYLYFENTDDLLECVAEELRQKIAVEPPFPVTDKTSLEEYANVIFDHVRENHPAAALLCGENGDLKIAYRLAEAVKDRLATAKNAAGITDAAVENCLNMASPSLSFYFIVGRDSLFEEEHAPLTMEIEYDRSHSMLANVSLLLAKRLGGSPYFHYDLLCAYVKLDGSDENAYRNITVTQLLATAGISRTEFYKYYKNIGDFFDTFEDACVHTALYWLASFLRRGWPNEAELNAFILNNDVRVSIGKFFTHGRITTYFPKLLNLVFRFVNGVVPGGLPEGKMLSFSYYVTVFAYAICTYLIGMSDYESLQKTFAYLQNVRGKYGV